ncbi:MAG TPA: glycosyltransferase, partial [Candidatus Hodarchaeales archaeon]|nr:glycosyltransferase [Candidatus Hodarchaeales archaeon]
MKVALVHDALVNRGGAERVFEVLCGLFPEANLFSTVYLPEKTYPYFETRNVITTQLQRFVTTEAQLKALFPLANWLMESLDIGDVDVVLSSSTFSAKYICKKNAKHICYCYTPFRVLWRPDSYSMDGRAGMLMRVLTPLRPALRSWDFHAAQKVDQFIAMTEITRQRILRHYRKDAVVIPPPIDCSRYVPSSKSEDFFLLVSRLEPYKKVDLVIEAFRKSGRRLKIVGSGALHTILRRHESQRIEFLGSIADDQLLTLYQTCRAVIFPQEEDYGLVPLEANACGKPVICYGRGGVETTMRPYVDDNESEATALFFYEQTSDSLLESLARFERISFKSDALVANARRFD